jgi:cyclomaltodextrinase
MLIKYNFYFIIILYLLFSGCEKKHNPDLIEFIKMDAGQADTLALQELFYAEGNIMDSHDQVRMMALLEGDITLAEDPQAHAWREPEITVDDSLTYKKERLFLTYLLTVPGVPIIYYGDEIGMTGAGDPDNRRLMRFSNYLTVKEKQQLKKISALVHLRKEHAAPRRGDYLPLYLDQNIFVFSRGDVQERLIIAMNKGEEAKKVKVLLPEWLGGTNAVSLLNNKEI